MLTQYPLFAINYASSPYSRKLVDYAQYTSQMIALSEIASIVLDGNLIKALDQMTGFDHTGNLEVYLLVLLIEVLCHFLHESMITQTELAALDNNHN